MLSCYATADVMFWNKIIIIIVKEARDRNEICGRLPACGGLYWSANCIVFACLFSEIYHVISVIAKGKQNVF